MEFDKTSLKLLQIALDELSKGFTDLPETKLEYINNERLKKIVMEIAERMKDNYPYFHPLYAGQMLKPPHLVAQVAYMLSLWINPNNHAYDGGRASSVMEKEAIADLANMFGWSRYLGHLCSGGTMANLEALWIAGEINPGKAIVASEQAHYTHKRISEVLKLKFRTIRCDKNGRMDINHLVQELSKGDIGTVVVTIGTTGIGAVDPLAEILELRKKYEFRIHADAAYGGYFVLVDDIEYETKKHLNCLPYVDSLVIDPHKHGLQPYGCGCVIFKDPSVGVYYKHESPYTYFTSNELHLGEISLECSRPGAAAVALWATQKLFPLTKNGEFARRLLQSYLAAKKLYLKIYEEEGFLPTVKPELDILTWAIRATNSKEIGVLSRKYFDVAAKNNLHLAIFNFPSEILEYWWKDVNFNTDQVTCLRSCLMKPEHLTYIDEIWKLMTLSLKKLFANKY